MTNFANRTIWTGDNLDILRGLNSASFDLIYLDPPFNSNRNYAAPVGSISTYRNSAARWSLRKSEMVRKSGVLLADSTRKAMSSCSRWAILLEDDTPMQ